MSLKLAALLSIGSLSLLLSPAPVAAQIVCCDVNGVRTCGNPPPPQCDTRPKTVFGKGGGVTQLEAPPTAEQRAARAAEVARKQEEEKQAIEQARRDRALLDSYSHAREIDAARDRAIADIEKKAEQTQNRLASAQAKQTKLAQTKGFHQNKPLPAHLQQQLEGNERAIAALQKALAQKDIDIAAARARYAADKERYRQLTGRK